jgi:hypothetical protein
MYTHLGPSPTQFAANTMKSAWLKFTLGLNNGMTNTSLFNEPLPRISTDTPERCNAQNPHDLCNGFLSAWPWIRRKTIFTIR